MDQRNNNAMFQHPLQAQIKLEAKRKYRLRKKEPQKLTD